MKINVRSSIGTAFVMGLSLIALTGCVGTESSFSPARRDVQADNLVDGDLWKATLAPVGTGTAAGEATMKVDGNSFVVEVETSGLTEGTHAQSVRSGTCAEIGDPILSLDGDLSSEDAGKEANPSSDVSGNYLYSESTDVSTVATDLDLAGKIVVVYGTDSTTPALCGVIAKEEAGEDDQGQPLPDQGQQQQQQQNQGQTEVSMPE